MCSENVSSAVNQQERLDAYIAGYVDGEGSFHVAICRNDGTRAGWQLVPEFHVSQNAERREVLDVIARRLGCGRVRESQRASKDTSLVFVVRKREDLLTKVIPFFEAQPLLSSKQQDFLTFARVVRAMDEGVHLTAEGLFSLATQIAGGLILFPGFSFPPLGTVRPMRDITYWLGTHVFHVSTLDYAGVSADTPFHWVQLAWLVFVLLQNGMLTTGW